MQRPERDLGSPLLKFTRTLLNNGSVEAVRRKYHNSMQNLCGFSELHQIVLLGSSVSLCFRRFWNVFLHWELCAAAIVVLLLKCSVHLLKQGHIYFMINILHDVTYQADRAVQASSGGAHKLYIIYNLMRRVWIPPEKLHIKEYLHHCRIY